jgi:hypothetical protein
MLDDNGNNLDAVILGIMHIPRLSRILFSITRFAKHGHFATIKQNYTTLYFSSKYAPVTLPAHDGKTLAVDIQVTAVKCHGAEVTTTPAAASNGCLLNYCIDS